jgi:uncharacterized membrane protein
MMHRYQQHSFIASLGMMLSASIAWSHGGLSSLEGMLELVLMVYLQGFLLLCWLVFLGIFIFKKQLNEVLFKRFRQVMYGLSTVLLLLLSKWLVAENFSLQLMIILISVLAGALVITEATIWVTRALRDDPNS